MKNEGTFLCPDCYHIFGGYGDQGCLKCRKNNHFQVDELLALRMCILTTVGAPS